MPRPILLSNGSLAVAIDSQGVLRDLYAPHVGYPNHAIDGGIRCGIRVGERFQWLDEASPPTQHLLHDALVATERYEALGREVTVAHAIAPESNAYERRIRVSAGSEPVALYFNQYLHKGQSDVGNTAFWHPEIRSLVHYRGSDWFAFVARADGTGPSQFACGIRGFGDYPGTWVEAPGGRLSGNPIAQGSVDSTLALDLPAGGSGEATFAIVYAHEDRALEHAVNAYLDRELTVEDERIAADADWLVAQQHPDFANIEPRYVDAFHKSFLLVRAHCDCGGAILAALDGDILETNRATYAYCWPRDGAHIADLMIELGDRGPAERFLQFCEERVSPERPFLMQKYRPDGALGATWHPWEIEGRSWVPHQLDETASVLASVAKFRDRFGEAPFPQLESLSLGWLRAQVAEDGSIADSYDLWEERYGAHIYTACVVADALRRWDEPELAASVEGWVERALCNGSHFCRRPDDETPDASSLFAGLLRLPLDQGKVAANLETIRDRLTVPGVGGIARYEGDHYFRRTDAAPGNPWLIATLWLGRATGTPDSLESALDWCLDHALPTGALPEQVHAETGEPLSVAPLAWSHAEFCWTVLALARARGQAG